MLNKYTRLFFKLTYLVIGELDQIRSNKLLTGGRKSNALGKSDSIFYFKTIAWVAPKNIKT